MLAFLVRQIWHGFLLVMAVAVFSLAMMIMSGVKESTRDDPGDCIAKVGFPEGAVERLYTSDFRSREGKETNYYARIRLDIETTCTANLSKYDYRTLSVGKVIFAGDASPFSYKVFGVRTNKELLEKYIFGLFITSIVGLFFAFIYIADKALHLSKRAEAFICWACGDVEMGLEAKSQVPFTSLGMLSAYVFTFSGLQGLGASDPIWLSAKVALGYSVMGGFFVVLQGGMKHFSYNARVLGVGTIMVVTFSTIFHFVFGLEYSYMFRSIVEQL
jgi:hypothetical protein